jgi:hypothetical protein
MFLEHQLGVTAETYQPEFGDPTEVIGLLWPFLKPLQQEPAKTFVEMMPYDPAGEADFDLMLMMMAVAPDEPLTNRSDAALTVWHERLTQAIVVLGANAALGKPVMLPPRELPEHHRQIAAACLWLHEMELPYFPGTVIAPTSPPGRA